MYVHLTCSLNPNGDSVHSLRNKGEILLSLLTSRVGEEKTKPEQPARPPVHKSESTLWDEATETYSCSPNPFSHFN